MLSVRRWRSVHQDFLVLTKLYSAVESSMNCSPRPAVRRASTLLRPTVRRQPSSSRAEASVTASTRVRVSCMNTSQSTTAEPARTSHLYMTCLCFTMNFKQLVPLWIPIISAAHKVAKKLPSMKTNLNLLDLHQIELTHRLIVMFFIKIHAFPWEMYENV